MEKNLFYDIIDGYATSSVFGITDLEELGIINQVRRELEEKRYVNFKQKEFNIPEQVEMSDIELMLDFYVGTILNSTPINFAKAYFMEIELPKKYIQFSQILKENPLLKWNNLYFATHYTQYNQLVLTYLGGEFNNTNNKFCFNLTSKF